MLEDNAATDNGNTDDEPDIHEELSYSQAIDNIGFGRFQLILGFFTGLCWMADAMEMLLVSVLGSILQCQYGINNNQKTVLTMVVFCGMGISGAFWGKFCDKFGRKTCIFASSLFSFYFGVLSAFSPSYIWVVFLRFLVGVGIGALPQSVTLYCEFLPSSTRASSILLSNVFWSIGASFESFLALVSGSHWRWLLALSAGPLLLFTCVASVWVPESGMYWLNIRRVDKASDTLNRVARTNMCQMPKVNLYIRKATKRPAYGAFNDLLGVEMRKTTIMLCSLWFIVAISYYGTVLFTTELYQTIKRTTDTDKDSIWVCTRLCLELKDYIGILLTSAAEIPGVFIAMSLLHWTERRTTIATELLAFSILTVILTVGYKRVMMTVILCGARMFISSAFQSIYVYTSEVYPTTMRALGLGTCSAIARFGAILSPFFAQLLFRKATTWVLCFFVCCGIAGAIISLCLPRETKGQHLMQTLEEY